MHRFARLLLLAFVCTGALAVPVRAANLLVNPGFESAGGSFTGWNTFSPALPSSVVLSTAANDNIMRTGAAAAKVYGGFVNCPFAPTFNVSGFLQTFPLAASSNTTFEFSCQAYVASADSIPGSFICNSNRAIIKLAFFNAATGGSEIQGSEAVIASPFTKKDQWNTFTVKASAPAAARRVEALILYLQPGCAGGAVYVDDLMLESYTTPSVSGNVLSNSNFSSPTGNGLVVPGWRTFGNVYFDGRALGSYSAGGAAKLFGTFNPGTNSVMYQSFKTTPGTPWQFSLNALTTCSDSPIQVGNDNQLVMHIAFMDATGTEIPGGPTEIAMDVTKPLGQWLNTSISGIAPAGTDSVRCYVIFEQPTNKGGAVFIDDAVFRTLPAAGVTPTLDGLALAAPQPNPSRGSALLRFTLPTEDEVSLRVFDVAGRGVATLLEGRRPAGQGSIRWDGRRADGTRAAAGIYQVVLRTSNGVVSRRMVLAN